MSGYRVSCVDLLADIETNEILALQQYLYHTIDMLDYHDYRINLSFCMGFKNNQIIPTTPNYVYRHGSSALFELQVLHDMALLDGYVYQPLALLERFDYKAIV